MILRPNELKIEILILSSLNLPIQFFKNFLAILKVGIIVFSFNISPVLGFLAFLACLIEGEILQNL